MKCKDCENFSYTIPDRWNEGQGTCSKHNLTVMLVKGSYKRKIENLECAENESGTVEFDSLGYVKGGGDNEINRCR